MDKILFLASWYPSRVDFLNGDFVERHAKAIALLYDVSVIFVSKDLKLKNKIYDFEYDEKDNLKVYKGFYKEYQSRFLILRKIVSQLRYFRCCHMLYRDVRRKEGRPDFVHLYIPMKAGVYALYLKIFKNLKYVISEQHSYYMPASNGYEKNSFGTKALIRFIFKNASAVHTVSKSLGEILIQKNIINRNFTVIPNVVNTEVFKPQSRKPQQQLTRFVTITGNVFHKNTDGIVRALKKVLDKKADFTLDIIGPCPEELKTLAFESGLTEHIKFHGAVSYETVAQIMSADDAMIFFTRYETFGCVIIEANACGLPVISSDLPVIKENISEGFNGIFVQSENENELAEKIIWYMDNKAVFDIKAIASFTANKFNYRKISEEFDEFYKAAFNSGK
jgi:glycosyltransferase involved in cell wall biosynthesis